MWQLFLIFFPKTSSNIAKKQFLTYFQATIPNHTKFDFFYIYNNIIYNWRKRCHTRLYEYLTASYPRRRVSSQKKRLLIYWIPVFTGITQDTTFYLKFSFVKTVQLSLKQHFLPLRETRRFPSCVIPDLFRNPVICHPYSKVANKNKLNNIIR